MPQLLLDTDILSALMRKNPAVHAQARAYLSTHRLFTFSVITRYEILRGLKAKDAHKQAGVFERFCARNRILPVTDEIIDRAADLYADLYKRGQLIGDADILIAATALTHGLGVVTNNEAHFNRITGLGVGNWIY
ncbi:MAG TPA: type II toxin-antitoxin system VapC family toxin [Blastocatellia bacterium]|nr:type II toxin-antitoxin system VapC family toxin [Blastocatellia bacterium]